MLNTFKIPSVLGMNSLVRFQRGDSQPSPCGWKGVFRGHKTDTNQNNSLDSEGSAPSHRYVALSQSIPAPRTKGMGRLIAPRFYCLWMLSVCIANVSFLPLAQTCNNDLCLNFLSFYYLFSHFLLWHTSISSVIIVIPTEQDRLSGIHNINILTFKRI